MNKLAFCFNILFENIFQTLWGQGGYKDELVRVVHPYVDANKCKENFVSDPFDAEKQICAAGYREKVEKLLRKNTYNFVKICFLHKQNTCGGDSGAPIQIAHPDAPCVYNIVGLVTVGASACANQFEYSIFTKTLHYLDWIESIVWPKPEETIQPITS